MVERSGIIKVLLTGFTPFGHYHYNPTQDLVHRLSGKKLANGKIIGKVLPCSYTKAADVAYNMIKKHKPDMVISFGLASRVPSLKLETRGQNIMNSRYTDSDGKCFSGAPIKADDKKFYYTSKKTPLLVQKLNKLGIKAEISNDAEGFICNTLVYLLSKSISESESPIPFVFIHTPWTDVYKGKITLEPGKIMITENNLDKAVEVIIKSLSH